jgi:hypothetical protein
MRAGCFRVGRDGLDLCAWFDRVVEYAPTAAQLDDLTGTYRAQELDVPYTVTSEGDRLLLHPPEMAEITLLPMTTDLFIGGDWRVRFTRDAQGQVSGFLVDTEGDRTQNLRFERLPP